MKQVHKFKIGDKVTFGCYGYFDIREPYTIVGINNTIPILGNKEYVLENESKHRITAYADEIIPI